jgi:hypothetical protein
MVRCAARFESLRLPHLIEVDELGSPGLLQVPDGPEPEASECLDNARGNGEGGHRLVMIAGGERAIILSHSSFIGHDDFFRYVPTAILPTSAKNVGVSISRARCVPSVEAGSILV